MGRFTKGKDLVAAQKRHFREVKVALEGATRELAENGLQDAFELTSGDLPPSITRGAFARTKKGARRLLSRATLKRRGLLFGYQAPGSTKVRYASSASVLRPLPVNMQSHRLHDSMVLRPITRGFALTQDNPGGGIWRLKPGGTSKLVDSGFARELRRRWLKRRAIAIRAVREAQGRR